MNKDGTISLEEMKAGYNAQLTRNMTDDEIEKAFFDADADGSG